MHNQNVNGVRRRAREGIAVEFDDKWPFPIATTDPTGGLLLRELDRALARISEEQREVIFLVGLEGILYGETAMILGVPIGTVRSRLSRGRNSLRELIDRRGETGAARDAAIPLKRRRLVPEDEPTQNFFSGADVAAA
jgi:RNA polymerase sigma-70 factor (ECF subfamily)